MTERCVMSEAYRQLARVRVRTRWPGYAQPEDFGYDFREWVSPYTKGAHAVNGIALVLQDWSSSEGLGDDPDPDVQRYGRTPGLRTNRMLEDLLARVVGLKLANVYATNVFPFIKSGTISSPLPFGDVVHAAEQFTRVELELARPRLILALGRVPFAALQRVGVSCYRLPHPAARIGRADAHARAWRAVLQRVGWPIEMHK